MTVFYLVVIVLVFLVAWIIYLYNKFIKLGQRVNNGWSQIDVQLKRRYDLIPNLVEVVRGYASHERETLQRVTDARAQISASASVKEQAEKNNILTDALKSLFAVVENYPQLKADARFKELQEELSHTENKISYARQFYNDSVMEYNTLCQSFPASILSNIFKFQLREYFEIEEREKEVPKVKF